ncbi:tail fiber assembly protein [Pseudomonas sp. MWU13-2105]|uniref:tail fiber assembly protein n=1 Tax=Pseudomonas sp. MWU13-2105 TaxID=2935074 RepID=UPI00200BA1BA|nr:tail fiber assembly protein [Pseudomonas sp. MWU13-2105]
MKYYIRRATGEVFAYESDGSQDSFISPDLELLDDKGLAEVRAAQEAAAAPTPEQVLQSANAQRDALLASAGLRIAPLQDAVDLDVATGADTVNLKLWKQYRVAINRVSEQPGFPATIDWPTPPA